MDMYLSSFPMIASFYDAEAQMVQLSLATCTVGMAIGQLCFGTLSDSFGRKKPLLLSLALYLAASLGCLLAPSITFFIFMRFFQGLAAAGGVVISRSVAADCYSGSALARMFGIIGMINGFSTVASPMFGGIVINLGGWKGVFILLVFIGIVMLLGSLCLKESLPEEKRVKLRPSVLLKDIRNILSNRIYSEAIVQYGCIMSIIFINLASGPFIMNDYGLDSGRISLIYGINAIALGLTAGIASRTGDMRRIVVICDAGMLLASVLIGAVLLLRMGFWYYEAAVFGLYLFVGAMCTATTTLAMDAERQNAGIASAFLGTTGYIAGGVISPLVGIGDIFVTTTVLFIAVSLLAFISNKMSSPRRGDLSRRGV